MNAYESRAQEMTLAQLRGALKDIAETLPLADHFDRVQGTSNGGRYRDEAAAYHAEIKRRRKKLE